VLVLPVVLIASCSGSQGVKRSAVDVHHLGNVALLQGDFRGAQSVSVDGPREVSRTSDATCVGRFLADHRRPTATGEVSTVVHLVHRDLPHTVHQLLGAYPSAADAEREYELHRQADAGCAIGKTLAINVPPRTDAYGLRAPGSSPFATNQVVVRWDRFVEVLVCNCGDDLALVNQAVRATAARLTQL
jgi:hypothetical protein